MIESITATVGALAAVVAVYFAWRAARDSRETTSLSKETVELTRQDRQEELRDRHLRRLDRIGHLIVDVYEAAADLNAGAVTRPPVLPGAQARLRHALVGFEDELSAGADISLKDSSPAGIGQIMKGWLTALDEVKRAQERELSAQQEA